ncbi:unnamed protein product [Tuber melanosporum]|uniref:(Perigord truffle) hypothetical protein n=1 Tax=Tuber melanosporum (strain Mel28) TaxID=656061 RepID=D5GNI5_TUBMM|nr:uncharacterized protein GSTUM_00011304001 [Tuber melanosporum]CAZ86078.1 unnamed protein product [Tuber melanosporum]
MPRITRRSKGQQLTSLTPTAPKPRRKASSSKAPSSSSAAAAPTPVDDDGTGPVYFWKPHEVPFGIFSQWYEDEFTAPFDGEQMRFGTAEQYMMYSKAVLFNDPDTAAEIMKTMNPSTQRALGRKVRNFTDVTWAENRSRIVEEGSYWKFKKDPSRLLETGDREMVEASPRDRIWGIGFGPKNADAGKRDKWGMNLLGKALMEARDRLRRELEPEVVESKGKEQG